jgi:hypothetical protein
VKLLTNSLDIYICKDRVSSLGLKAGDYVSVTYIGGEKPRKYKGFIQNIANGCIYLQQTKREMTLDVHMVDEIEKIKPIHQGALKVKNNKVVYVDFSKGRN